MSGPFRLDSRSGDGEALLKPGTDEAWREPAPGPIRLRISRSLFKEMKADLQRPHAFAAERVGFLSVATGRGEADELLVLGGRYEGVSEDHYLKDPTVGARIGVEAIREAINRIRASRCGLFHVHLHEHRGVPRFSFTDRREQSRLVESFYRAGGHAPHGMLVLSDDSATAWVWLPGESKPALPASTSIVGYPMTFVQPTAGELSHRRYPVEATERYERQSFLGPGSQDVIGRVRIGVIGLGGGGSHVVQQLAHVGFTRMRGFDGDVVDETNLNRLIGARADDVSCETPKAEVAARLVYGLLPHADVILHDGLWQDRPELLRGCDLVVGCVDSFAERHELEVACRRYLIPYIDIGMDVHRVGEEPPRMGGQVILSMPGGPCMQCLGFLTEGRLAQEADRYGDTGGRPQVVWPNGVLASTAVGVAVDLVTGWSRQWDRLVYLSYDGNTGELKPHVRLRFLRGLSCAHFNSTNVGDPVFRRVVV